MELEPASGRDVPGPDFSTAGAAAGGAELGGGGGGEVVPLSQPRTKPRNGTITVAVRTARADDLRMGLTVLVSPPREVDSR